MYKNNTNRDLVDVAYDQLSENAVASFRAKQIAFSERLAEYTSWNVNNDECTIVFSRVNGDSLEYRLTPIATYLHTSENWAWAWANDAFSSESRTRSAKLKTLANVTEYKIFETPSFRVEANEVDELCALALYHLEGIAVFKIKDDEPWFLYVVE
jgi:hypothetical protein